MEMQQKYIVDACTKALYDGKPQGPLLESVKEFERKLTAYAEEHPKSNMLLQDSGLQDEYGQLYMAVMNGNNEYSTKPEAEQPKAFDYSKEQRIPTVHEFLDSYRLVYEKAIKPNNRPLTAEAYEKLFEVESRTDDLIEAQIIIEKEGLILNTVTADYKYIAEDFMEAADPNYEVTSASVAATIGVYATAKSLEEITYMGELARATCDDLAVKIQLKVSIMVDFMALIFAWEHAKKKVREGRIDMVANAGAMVVTRKKMREYYRFLCEDMGITFEIMEKKAILQNFHAKSIRP